MIATVIFAVAVLAAPAILVVLTLFVLGSAVAGLVDGATHGLARPSPS